MGGVAQDRGCSLIAVDNSPSMVEQCRENLAKLNQSVELELRCEDVRTTTIEQASLVTMNFTLQFLPLVEREPLLRRIAEGTVAGGALMLSEKVCFENSEKQQQLESLHHAFKRANGYSELEISQKRSALEAVLIAETIEQHLQRLKRVGYAEAEVLFQALNFVTIVAVR
jgi:tRNA (cmo5U34)-methyltransferase